MPFAHRPETGYVVIEGKKVLTTWPVALLDRIDRAAKAAGMNRSDWLRRTVERSLAPGSPTLTSEAPRTPVATSDAQPVAATPNPGPSRPRRMPEPILCDHPKSAEKTLNWGTFCSACSTRLR